MNRNILSESARTVTFTVQEAKIIADIVSSFDPEAPTEALETIAQHLLNTSEDLPHAMGDHFFTLRQVRDFHNGLIDRLRPVGEAYQDARSAVEDLHDEE